MKKPNYGWFTGLFIKEPPMTNDEIRAVLDGLISQADTPRGFLIDAMQDVETTTMEEIVRISKQTRITQGIINEQFERIFRMRLIVYLGMKESVDKKNRETQSKQERLAEIEAVVRKVIRLEIGNSHDKPQDN